MRGDCRDGGGSPAVVEQWRGAASVWWLWQPKLIGSGGALMVMGIYQCCVVVGVGYRRLKEGVMAWLLFTRQR
ncbi:hypothetical protein FXO38_23970 [Capsicum annuum]|nr:hypothetical protein FXO38_23970 [Capsicum annuum]